MRGLLTAGPYPSRRVQDNLADVAAQIAANQQGAMRLKRLMDTKRESVVLAYMRHIQDAAETKMRQALRRLPRGTHDFVDHLDDGSVIHVAISISDSGGAEIDFTGSAGVHPGNLNANPAIVRAAVIYCLRCLIDEDIPLNEGVLKPVHLTIPPGLLNPPDNGDPARNAAVVGGNVETSQRLVDALLGAATRGGQPRNDEQRAVRRRYVRLLRDDLRGAGATPLGPGADAVHTHMTNTRLTDPEVLEHRYPVQLLGFEIRRGSGGAGRNRGGDGVIRRLRFTQPLQLSLLSQRRGEYPPYGLAGGEPGQCGRNVLVKADGTSQRLPGQTQLRVSPGDVLIMETPGGGGYGWPHR